MKMNLKGKDIFISMISHEDLVLHRGKRQVRNSLLLAIVKKMEVFVNFRALIGFSLVFRNVEICSLATGSYQRHLVLLKVYQINYVF